MDMGLTEQFRPKSGEIITLLLVLNEDAIASQT